MPADRAPVPAVPVPLAFLAAAGAGAGIWWAATAVARRLPPPLPHGLPADPHVDGAVGLLREGYT